MASMPKETVIINPIIKNAGRTWLKETTVLAVSGGGTPLPNHL